MTSLHKNHTLTCIAIAVSILVNCCYGFKPSLLSTRHASGLCIYAKTSLTSAGDSAVRSQNHPETVVFAGVKFGGPIAKSLRKLGITDPSPIQKASIAPLTTGLTCILHAQTGSGKTFAYLLPLLKRLVNADGVVSPVPLQGLILVPTKELAVQVAADIAALLGMDAHSVAESESPVHLCLTTSRKGLDEVKSPIVVGTPFKVLDAFRASQSSTISSFSFVVLDEVDRILNAVGRYATNEDKRVAKQDKMPIEEILARLQQLKAENPDSADLQVVAASATVGRPMRREMFRLLNGGETFGDIPVIRPTDDEDENDNKSGDMSVSNSNKAQQGSTRKVGIPSSIRHIAMLTQDDSKELNSKLVVAKEKWVGEFSDAKRGLLFVPRAEDVRSVLGILRFWGLREAQNLQQTLGIEADQARPQVPTPTVEGAPKRGKSAELIAKAATTRIGAAARLDNEETLLQDTSSSSSSSSTQRDLFVVPVSGTRGLHVQDVEYVIILSPPKTMDEYLHMAGRTGRSGNRSKGGTVISLVNFDEMKRLKSWETALGIEFEVEYQ